MERRAKISVFVSCEFLYFISAWYSWSDLICPGFFLKAAIPLAAAAAAAAVVI
jgi:hypothetical protein